MLLPVGWFKRFHKLLNSKCQVICGNSGFSIRKKMEWYYRNLATDKQRILVVFAGCF